MLQIGTHTHTHTQKCVILIAFPQQQWFREGASVLRYAYIACLVLFSRSKCPNRINFIDALSLTIVLLNGNA